MTGEVIDIWTSLDKHTMFVKVKMDNGNIYTYVKSFDDEINGFECRDTKPDGELVYYNPKPDKTLVN